MTRNGKFVYITGSWSERHNIRNIGIEIEERGGVIVNHWFDGSIIKSKNKKEWYCYPEIMKQFKSRFESCDDCHIFILHSGKGVLFDSLVELGMCYTLDYPKRKKRIIAVGDRINSIMLKGIEYWYDSIEELLDGEKWVMDY